MRLNLIPFLVLLLAQVGFSGLAEAKKTVCTVTINSDEEAAVFKKSLDPQLWNFIELSPSEASTPKSGWLADSCKPEIQCDILLVSGHFGGTFFGRSGYTLPMNELEERSCDASCDGITKRPKEVFLFGCNTLASKQADSRTPEQYYNVLIQDGFTPREASQITALRYSAFGSSFRDRMSQVFEKTPRIYGFSSIGPSGKKVKPLLEGYMTSARSDYDHFDQTVLRSGTAKNGKLFTALKVTAIDQAVGFNVQTKSRVERPYCVLSSNTKSRLQKLTYILELFQQQQALNFLSHINSTIAMTTWENLSAEEISVLKTLRELIKSNTELQHLLSSKSVILIKAKADIYTLFRDLKIISDTDYHSALAKLIKLDQPFTDSRVATLCDLDLHMNIATSDIPAERWTEPAFLDALYCLRPANLSLLQEVERRQGRNRSYLLSNLIRFSTARSAIELEHEDYILKHLTGANTELQTAAGQALNSLKKISPTLSRKLLSLLNSQNASVRALVAKALIKTNMSEAETTAVVKTLREDPDTNVRVAIAESLGEAGVKSQLILDALQKASASTDEVLMLMAFTALQRLQPEP